MWLVKTSFAPQEYPTWRGIIEHVSSMARDMGLNIRLYKGKGRVTDPQRHFYWEFTDEKDALAFFLACGNEIKQIGKRN